MRKLLFILLLIPIWSFGQSGVTMPGISSPRWSLPLLTYRYYAGGFHLLMDKDSAALVYQPIITLTTSGSSGAATFIGNVLNIPSYSGGSGATGANPSTIIGVTPVNGSATTFMRSDAAPRLDTALAQTIANFFPKGDTRYVTLGTAQTITAAKTISATLTSNNITAASDNIYGLGSAGVRYGAAYITVTQTGTVKFGATNLLFTTNGGTNVATWFGGTGNLQLQNGGTFTENNYKLSVSTAGSAGYFKAGNLLVDASSNPILNSTSTAGFSWVASGTTGIGAWAKISSLNADTITNPLATKAYVNNFLTKAAYATSNANNAKLTGGNSFTGNQFMSTLLQVPEIDNINNSSGFVTIVKSGATSSNWNVTWPDKGGTPAMISDLTPVVSFADLTAQTAANTSVATYTTTADGSYRIGGYVNITAVTVDVIEMQVTYTDENSTSQTANFFTQGATSALLSAVGNSAFPTIDIRCKTGTAITVKTTLTTGTGSISYDAGATITKLR